MMVPVRGAPGWWPAGWGLPDRARVPHFFPAAQMTSLCGRHSLGPIGRGGPFTGNPCQECSRRKVTS